VAPVQVDPSRVREFPDTEVFATWLAGHHATDPEVWIKIHKKGSGLPSITPAAAIEICLRWGWIDAIRKRFDDASFLQRYTPRGPRSSWSQVNVATVERLITDGLMTEHGLRHVEAAKADGRWAGAYRIKGAQVPPDLQAAIDAEPAAQAMFARLSSQNRFALIYRTEAMKTEAGRSRKIAAFVEMLTRGETVHPQTTSKTSAQTSPIS
jgi:uncharacterized protein YdeI (YjbR/CyaY-like superfamily)